MNTTTTLQLTRIPVHREDGLLCSLLREAAALSKEVALEVIWRGYPTEVFVAVHGTGDSARAVELVVKSLQSHLLEAGFAFRNVKDAPVTGPKRLVVKKAMVHQGGIAGDTESFSLLSASPGWAREALTGVNGGEIRLALFPTHLDYHQRLAIREQAMGAGAPLQIPFAPKDAARQIDIQRQQAVIAALDGPLAGFHLEVAGSDADETALVTARVMSAFSDSGVPGAAAEMTSFPADDFSSPWATRQALQNKVPLMAALLTPDEVSSIARIPSQGDGFDLEVNPFSLFWDRLPGAGSGSVRLGYSPVDKSEIRLSEKDLFRHVFIGGRTGSGKGVLISSAISSLVEAGFRVICINPVKGGDFRAAAIQNQMKILSPGNGLQLNLFHVPSGIDRARYKALVNQCLQASISMEGMDNPLPAWFQMAVTRAFALWPGDFDFSDFVQVFHETVQNSRYKHETRNGISTAGAARIAAMCERSNGLFSFQSLQIKDILSGNGSLIELGGLSEDAIRLSCAILFQQLKLYLTSDAAESEPPAVVILDEAHVLVSKEGESTGESRVTTGAIRALLMDFFTTLRKHRTSVWAADQTPSLVGGPILDGIGTKILMALEGEESLAGSTACGMSAEQGEALALLRPGEGVVSAAGRKSPLVTKWDAAVNRRVSDEEVAAYMAPWLEEQGEARSHPYRLCRCKHCQKHCRRRAEHMAVAALHAFPITEPVDMLVYSAVCVPGLSARESLCLAVHILTYAKFYGYTILRKPEAMIREIFQYIIK